MISWGVGWSAGALAAGALSRVDPSRPRCSSSAAAASWPPSSAALPAAPLPDRRTGRGGRGAAARVGASGGRTGDGCRGANWWNGPVKALLLENIHPDAVATLEAAGFEVVQHEGDGRVRARRRAARRAAARHPLQHQGHRRCPRGRARPAGRRRVLHRHQPDRPRAAAAAGVAVFNAPFSNTRSVVELADRRDDLADPPADREERRAARRASGTSRPPARTRCAAARLGIVGYGNIGSQLSVLAEALGMGVVFYDTADKLPMGNARSSTPSTSCSSTPTS